MSQKKAIYMRLLCFAWEHGSLPNDAPLLTRLAHGTPVPAIVMGKFELGPDNELRNPRMERERAKLLGVTEQRRNAPLCAVTPIPTALNRDGFPEAWADYEQHRIERNEPLTSMTRRQLMLKCERMGAKDATKAIRQAIGASWKNIHEPHELNGFNGKLVERPKERKPSALENEITRAKDVLRNLQSKPIAEVDKCVSFLRTLSDSGIDGYFSSEEKVIIDRITS